MTGASVPPRAKAWRGRAVAAARDYMRQHKRWPVKCGQCGNRVHLEDNWVVGHKKPRATHPELTWEVSNWQIEHRKCSDATGQSVVIAKAKQEALRQHGISTNSQNKTRFSPTTGPRKPPPLPLSLSDDEDTLSGSRNGVQEVPRELRWDPVALGRYAWLQDLLEVPEDASVPLMMTPVPDDAVCSYGWDGCEHMPTGGLPAVPWIEVEQEITLRWWQRLSLIRQLEHRADGSLCWFKKVESAPRRAGKSVGLRGGTLWRLAHGQDLFGEVQTAIHTGSDMAICREIQMKAWTWAERRIWTVTRGNGKEAITTLAGDRWLVRAQDAVYGYDVHYALVDEGWNVKPDTVSEGLEPAALERPSPQLVLTSTAHRRATSLMRVEIASAQAGEDPTVLLILWAAPKGSDPGDPRVWKAASPHWSEARHKLIEGKYLKALNGEGDPEFDDPDPMRGFEAQYLNVWHLHERKTVGTPIVSDEDWAELATRTVMPEGAPHAVAVESWFDAGVSVAQAWNGSGGAPVRVRVDDYQTLAEAVEAIAGLGYHREVLAGSTLADEVILWRKNRLRVKGMKTAVRSSVQDLSRLMNDRSFLHDGSPELAEQVLAMRTSPGTDGPRVRSTERADAIKATAWAVQAAKAIPNSGPGNGRKVIAVDW